MTDQPQCISGSVILPDPPTDRPFHMDNQGRICFNGEVYLTKTRTLLFSTYEVPWGEVGYAFVEALNAAYNHGRSTAAMYGSMGR